MAEAEFRRAGLTTGFGRPAVRELLDGLRPRLQRFLDDEDLCNPTKRQTHLWVIKSGSVRILERSDRRLRHVTQQGAGGVIGELELLKRQIRPATVTAAGPVEAWAVSYEAIEHLPPEIKAQFIWNLARVMAEKLDEARVRQASLTARNNRDQTLLRRFVPQSGLSHNERDEVAVTSAYENARIVLYFSDIVGFSDIAERTSAEDAAALVHKITDAQTRAIAAQNGEIDKFMGDGVMAWWIIHPDTPRILARQCARAFTAAHDAIAAVTQIADPSDSKKHLAMRVGLHAGSAHIGNYGSATRSAFTVIGRDVNIAARLEQARSPTPGVEFGALRISDTFAKELSDEQRKLVPLSASLTVKNTPIDMWYSER
jgi:class 3 adenylate cyclase